jgi:hypothetical protein
MSDSTHSADMKPAGSPDGQGNSLSSTLEGLAHLELADNDRIRALAAAGEAWAAASLKEQEARFVSDYAQQFEDDLEALARRERQAAKTIDDLSKKAKFARAFLRGTSLTAYSQCVDAFKHFEQWIPAQVRSVLFNPLVIPGARPIQGSDFFPNGKSGEDGQDPPERALRNAASLLSWSFERRYIARDGSAAQQIFLAAFDAVDAIAQEALNAIRKRTQEMRDDVERTWNPVRVIPAFTNSPQENMSKAKPAPKAGE